MQQVRAMKRRKFRNQVVIPMFGIGVGLVLCAAILLFTGELPPAMAAMFAWMGGVMMGLVASFASADYAMNVALKMTSEEVDEFMGDIP